MAEGYPEQTEVRIRFIADTTELEQKLKGVGGGGGGAAPSGPGARTGDAKERDKEQKRKQSVADVMKNLTPLAKIGSIAAAVAIVASNSTIIKTYNSAFQKIIGAAADTIIAPFLPLINLLMMAMMKILQWIMSSTVQTILKDISGIIQDVIHYIQDIWNFFKNPKKALGDAFSTAMKSPEGMIALIPTLALVAVALNKIFAVLIAPTGMGIAGIGGRLGIPGVQAVGGGIGAVGVRGAAMTYGMGGKLLGAGAGAFMGYEGYKMGGVAGGAMMAGGGALAGFSVAGLPGAIIGGIAGGIASLLTKHHSPSPLEQAMAYAVQKGSMGGGSKSAVFHQSVVFNVPLREKVDQRSMARELENYNKQITHDFMRGR